MDAVDNAAGSGIVFFTSPMDLLEESHGEGHAEDLHDEDAHPGRPENVLVVVKPRLDLFVASRFPD